MKLYYWNKKKNFGDLLSPLIIKRFTHIDSVWSSVEDAEIIAVGSILEHLPKEWKGVILGSGKLHEHSAVDLSFAKILALRGPLSAKGIKGNYALGDIGLLGDELVPNEDKEFELGLMPHWTDTELEHNPTFTKYNPKIIRVSDDPLKIISEIGRCKKIVSSSLHGIILADAFNIPRQVEIAPLLISKPHQEGGIFKWLDYSGSIGVPFEPGVTKEVDRNLIIKKQHELFDVLEEVKSIFRNGGKN